MDNKNIGLEGNRRRTRDQAGVTEHQVGAGWRAGGGIPVATSGECVCGFSTKDEAGEGQTHLA